MLDEPQVRPLPTVKPLVCVVELAVGTASKASVALSWSRPQGPNIVNLNQYALRPGIPLQATLFSQALLAAQALVQLEPLGDTGVFGGEFLRALLVVPEAGLAHRLLELSCASC